MEITGQKISIIGAARSGIGAAKLAKKIGAEPFVSDMSNYLKLEGSIEILKQEGIKFEFGKHSEKVYDCGLMVTSPGVPSDSDVILGALNRDITVISELEFASRYCKGNIIAITGTNGKTTTINLCEHVLNYCGKKTYAAGNVGLALSEIVLDLSEHDFVALETSSFQLDHIEKFKPKISVILNITPDHLDRYQKSFDNYIVSKMNILRNQNSDDFFIYNLDDSNIDTNVNYSVAKYGFSLDSSPQMGAYLYEGGLYFVNNEVRELVSSTIDLIIPGKHNIQNALAVLIIAKLLGCDNQNIKVSFSKFNGVEHRLEFVRELNGVKFINDSKATNVESVFYALQSFENPILLILGGKDKGNDYNKILGLVKDKVKKIYAIGSSSTKIGMFFKDIVQVELKNNLTDSLNSAIIDASPDDIVLLSPACASFDMFDNYEHRGKEFKKVVLELSK
ncbi:UDP-N-acetylmuramoyl-L-alanine--D-glutamate ligase [Bacteroidota bacterium]